MTLQIIRCQALLAAAVGRRGEGIGTLLLLLLLLHPDDPLSIYPKPPALPELFLHTFLGSRLHISARSGLLTRCHWLPITDVPGSGPKFRG